MFGRVLAQPAKNIFHIDHCVIHDLADCNGEPAQRHRVDGETHPIHHRQCGEKRQWDRGTGNGRRANVEQEEKEHQDDKRRADQQRNSNIMNRRVDKVRRAEEIGPHVDPFLLERRIQFLKRRLYLPGDIQRVRSVLGGNNQNDAGLPFHRCRAEGRRSSFTHLRDLSQNDIRAVLPHQHCRSNLLRGNGLPLALENQTLILVLDKSSAEYCRGLLCRSHHLIQRKAVLYESVGQNLHLQLLDFAAKDGDVRHARDGQKARPQGPVGSRSQLHQRLLARGQSKYEYGAGG